MKNINLNLSNLSPVVAMMLLTAPKPVMQVALLTMAQMIADRNLDNAPTDANSILVGVIRGSVVAMAEKVGEASREASVEEQLSAKGVSPDVIASLERIFKG